MAKLIAFSAKVLCFCQVLEDLSERQGEARAIACHHCGKNVVEERETYEILAGKPCCLDCKG